MYYLLCFIKSCFSASAGMFVKKYDKKAESITQSAVAFNLMLAVFSLVYYFCTGITEESGVAYKSCVIGYAMLRAVGYVLGSFGYLMAVHTGPLFITIVISELGALIPILYSIFVYQEAVQVQMILGMLLTFAALFVFNKKGKINTGMRKGYRLWVLMSFSGNGIAMLASKAQQHAQPGLYKSSMLFWSTLGIVVIFGIMALINPPRYKDTVKPSALPALCVGIGWTALYTLSNASVNYLGTITVSKLPAIVYFMISTGFSIVLSFLMARFIFKEKLTKQQYMGCAMALVALCLLTL